MNAAADGPLLLHIREAAKVLGISQSQLRKVVDAERIRNERIANRIYIPEAAIAEYIESIGQSA